MIFKPGTIDQMSFLVIGCGGIGSNVCNMLARMGAGSIKVYDKQIVEPENVSPGFFLTTDLGLPKVTAVGYHLLYGSKYTRFTPHQELYQRQRGEFDVVITTTDNMKSRRNAYNNPHLKRSWFIDSRMGADQCSVYCVNEETGDGRELFEKMLALRGEDTPCGLKATAPLTLGMIPGMIGTCLYNIANHQPVPTHIFWKMGVPYPTVVMP